MPSLPSLALERAAAAPREPWLFVRRGWDWKWCSRAAAAARLVAAAADLRERLARPRRAAYVYRSELVPFLLDLALQAAGSTAVPLTAEGSPPALAAAAARRGAEVWVEPARMEDRTPGVEPPAGLPGLQVDLGGALDERRGAGGGADLSPEGSSAWPRPGGAVVVSPAGDPLVLSARELVEGASLLGERLGSGPERDIVVLSRPLERRRERCLAAWAVVSGAALVLEPHPASAVATAAWARPTIFAGTVEELVRLRRYAEAPPPPFVRLRGLLGRGWHLPFGRLRTVLVAGELAAEERRWWVGEGVRVLPFEPP